MDGEVTNAEIKTPNTSLIWFPSIRLLSGIAAPPEPARVTQTLPPGVTLRKSSVLSVRKELPNDWCVHAARGLTLSGLGRREEALREARWLERSRMRREGRSGFQGVTVARAQILIQGGDTRGVLEEIERLLAGPSWLSVHNLQLDPLWDPLRSDPQFQALLAKAAQVPSPQ
jgi:hypothetical protein